MVPAANSSAACAPHAPAMRHATRFRTTFTTVPSRFTNTTSMAKRMNAVCTEKHGRRISAARGSRLSRPSSPLRRDSRVSAISTSWAITWLVRAFINIGVISYGKGQFHDSEHARHQVPRDAAAVRLVFAIGAEHALFGKRAEDQPDITAYDHQHVPPAWVGGQRG